MVQEHLSLLARFVAYTAFPQQVHRRPQAGSGAELEDASERSCS